MLHTWPLMAFASIVMFLTLHKRVGNAIKSFRFSKSKLQSCLIFPYFQKLSLHIGKSHRRNLVNPLRNHNNRQVMW